LVVWLWNAAPPPPPPTRPFDLEVQADGRPARTFASTSCDWACQQCPNMALGHANSSLAANSRSAYLPTAQDIACKTPDHEHALIREGDLVIIYETFESMSYVYAKAGDKFDNKVRRPCAAVQQRNLTRRTTPNSSARSITQI